MAFSFTLDKTHQTARAGTLTTDHGVAKTPMFMTVGTAASVKSLDSADLARIQPQVVLANTYHLWLRPGDETVAALGGVHKFMNWSGPMLTDSGGFQVFSLGEQLSQKNNTNGHAPKPVKIDEEGVTFYSHLDGSQLRLNPEKSIQIQQNLGADIIMAFDECLPDSADATRAESSLHRTARWLERSVAEWERGGRVSVQGHAQALFGITQGGQHRALRELATRQVLAQPVSGIAFGGETVGYNMPMTVELMNWLRPLLPEGMPRYAMGLGLDPQNLLDAVMAGYDMFDCVSPTRLGRNGSLYQGWLDTSVWPWQWKSDWPKGRLPIRRTEFARDPRPIQEDCDCYTCQSGYSRGYLRHLFLAQEISFARLACIHNVRTFTRITEQLRSAIVG